MTPHKIQLKIHKRSLVKTHTCRAGGEGGSPQGFDVMLTYREHFLEITCLRASHPQQERVAENWQSRVSQQARTRVDHTSKPDI